MLARLLLGMPHDVLWRIEYEGDAAMTPRRSTWMTAAAVGAAVSVAAVWVFFAVTSLVALPPLPGSIDVARIYCGRCGRLHRHLRRLASGCSRFVWICCRRHHHRRRRRASGAHPSTAQDERCMEE